MRVTARRELKIGLLGSASYNVLKRFTGTPQMILGVLFGFSLSCFILGMFSDKIYLKIKSWKKFITKFLVN